ncbi:MAG: polysaccharide biosynthesis/export family protein [Cyclobacteriaceae bacterium]|jgi:polysaccharide export outer membrane protein|nr:polysaccharide biosynthesis/export family protein [Cyclobacteriaceae bacterium]
MFKPTDTAPAESYQQEAATVSKDYVIQPSDVLEIDIFSNKGERIIDPNPELSNPANTATAQPNRRRFQYLVDSHGEVKLPMIGTIRLVGLTLREAEQVVQKEFETYFKEAYVVMNFVNKRIVLLGAVGGQVIPLANPSTTLVEALAMGKGLPNDAKANNIRVIRGDRVYQVDLSTIDGYRKGNMVMESGDIVYVEPIRRPFSEAGRDNTGVLGILIGLATLAVIIVSQQ